ncbi:hypothetical protein [Pleomorphomonas carboxyditropha]|uniref:hypothetical protein n=1 Tax=Pleomorphomonas carboxyditropha TaxID=2023338 RepID=UPI001055ACFA|nr:hypothetical protein [Pleomorphomonas carboxyditropha]
MPPSEASKPTYAIHTLWVYGELGPLEKLCLKSWVRLGYRVVLHSYDHPQVPDGVELFNAAQLIPESQVFRTARKKSLAIFSDLYRVTIMKHFEALWLDADIFLVRHFDFSGKNILAYEGHATLESINNAVLKLEPNHPIVEEIIGRFQNPLRGLSWKNPHKTWVFFRRSLLSCNMHAKHLPWGALGRLAIFDMLQKNTFDGQILPPEYCLTALQVPLFDAIDDPEKYLSMPLVLIHFYKSHIKKDLNNPTPGSIYETLSNFVEN